MEIIKRKVKTIDIYDKDKMGYIPNQLYLLTDESEFKYLTWLETDNIVQYVTSMPIRSRSVIAHFEDQESSVDIHTQEGQVREGFVLEILKIVT